jgi:hypothetical protein
MERDGLEEWNAEEVVDDLIGTLKEMIDDDCGLTELEDYFMGELGLEPDYLDIDELFD